MNTQDIKNRMIQEGDYVIDRLDDDNIREITGFTVHDEKSATVHLADGGVMGIDEINSEDIRLESEVIH